MDLNYIKEFIVLADVGNYLEAAEQLYISQSSLSRHIQSMEDELGTPLFNRNRRISLSGFGEIFLPYARKMIELQQSCQQELFEYKRGIQGSLSIGSIPSMAQYRIIDVLLRFEKEYPDYTLNTIEGDPLRLMEMISEDRLELAFVRHAGTLPDKYRSQEFTRDTLAAVMPASHPLASRANIQLKDLQHETLLLLTKNTYMYNLCIHACQEAGFEPKIGYTGHRSENLLAMAEKGAGIALLTQNPIRRMQRPSIRIVEIVPQIVTSISLIWKRDRKLSPAARRFLMLVQEMTNSD